MKKKILHIVGKASYDGTSVFASRLAENLKEYESVILYKKAGSALNEMNEKNSKIILLSLKNELNAFQKALAVLKYIIHLLNNNYDIIHYHSGGISLILFSVIFKKKSRIIHHLHCGNLNCKQDSSRLNFFEKILYKFTGRYTVKIAAAEHVKKKYLKIFGGQQEISLIKNCVPGGFRKKYGVQKVIGYIGQVDKFKGINEIKKILKIIDENKMSIAFRIKGDVYTDISFLDTFKNVIVEEPSLKVSDFYKNIDLLFFPSKSPVEGLPLVLLEAINYDVGVIALNTKAVEELLIDYPLLLDEFSLEGLNEILNKYYSDAYLRKELSVIHQKISEEHSYENIVKEIIKIYSE